MGKIKNHINKKTVKEFLKFNKSNIIQMGIITGSVLLLADTSFANDMQSTKITITALDTSLNGIKDVLTGPVPKITTLVGVALGAGSWTMGLDQQVSKWAIRAIGGGSVGMGAGEVIEQVTGCLF